jgi:hypothetical protein
MPFDNEDWTKRLKQTKSTEEINAWGGGGIVPATNGVLMSSMSGSTTQNAGTRLSGATAAQYNSKICNVLRRCVREIGGSPCSCRT